MNEVIRKNAEKILDEIIEKGYVCSAKYNTTEWIEALFYLVEQGLVSDFTKLGISYINECYMFTLADNSLGLVEQCDSYGFCKMVKTK